MVIPVCAVKFAVTVSGALIVTDVDGALAFATLPLQPVNEYPLLAVATTGTTVPRL
jgi:hypothetical protein